MFREPLHGRSSCSKTVLLLYAVRTNFNRPLLYVFQFAYEYPLLKIIVSIEVFASTAFISWYGSVRSHQHVSGENTD